MCARFVNIPVVRGMPEYALVGSEAGSGSLAECEARVYIFLRVHQKYFRSVPEAFARMRAPAAPSIVSISTYIDLSSHSKGSNHNL